MARRLIVFRITFSLVLLFSAYQTSFAQKTLVIVGSIVDSASRTPVTGARVQVQRADSSVGTGAVSDRTGAFVVHGLGAGQYTIVVQALGYATLRRRVPVQEQMLTALDTLKLPPFRLATSAVKLGEVDVTAQALRVEIKGDTTEFNARAFKTDKNAAAEDLIRKLPGIEIDPSGTVKTQGENVRRVLVDGKPFFGDDPTAALRNLPSEIIDKVQVIDQMSEQSQFTRFDDGDRTKTLNIITRPDRRSGQFGKLYGGYGTDERYSVGGNVNFFGGDRRISVIGMSNNINQQNFSVQDILGVMGGGGSRGAAAGANMMRQIGGGRGGSGTQQIRLGGGGGGTNPSDFLVGQSDGISAAHGLGLNYSDSWDKVLTITGSYFGNYTDNKSNQTSNRQYFLTGGETQLSNQTYDGSTQNMNHRLSFRVEYTMDSANSFILTPRLTLQTNDRLSTGQSGTTTEGFSPLNASNSKNNSDTKGFTFNNELLWRHKFATDGRTLSASITTALNRNSGEANNTSQNSYYNTTGILVDSLRQDVPSNSNGMTLGANLSYTEPIHDKGSIQLSYNANLTRSESDKRVYDFNAMSAEYDRLNATLSNTFKSNYLTQRPGISYRWAFATGATFSVGADYQLASLSSDQTFPQALTIERQFQNILPSASFTMRFSRTDNLRINYRASTNAPSIRQLQNVVDNSNPLQLSAGNPDLQQEYTHTITANYATFNIQTANSFFAVFAASLTANKIGNTTTIAGRDTTLEGGINLGSGAQFTRPTNLDGYRNMRAFLAYGFTLEPVSGMKLNVNVNGSGTYTRDVSLINSVRNTTDNYALAPGLTLSSNISEDLDFTLSARTTYTIARNSIQQSLDNNYFSHSVYFKFNYIFLGGFVLSSDFNLIATTGLTGGYNQSIPLLSVGIGRRFFDGNGELKLSVFDALDKNTSITRNIGSGYIEDVRTAVLRRYALLTFSYNLRSFGG